MTEQHPYVYKLLLDIETAARGVDGGESIAVQADALRRLLETDEGRLVVTRMRGDDGTGPRTGGEL